MNEEQLEGSEPTQKTTMSYHDACTKVRLRGTWFVMSDGSDYTLVFKNHDTNVVTEIMAGLSLRAAQTLDNKMRDLTCSAPEVEMNMRNTYGWWGAGEPNEGNPANGETPKLPAKEKSENGRGESLPSEEA